MKKKVNTEVHFIDESRPKSEAQFPGIYNYLRKRDLSEQHYSILISSILVLEALYKRKLTTEEVDKHLDWSYEFYPFYMWLSGHKIKGIEKMPLPPELISLFNQFKGDRK